MTETPQNLPDANSQPDIDAQELLRSLRRKEGNWVEWGKACQSLQKADYSPQTIFEETGFEPIHQNQIIVAAQVYDTLVSAGAPEPVQQHFQRKGSDILYEFRILAQPQRVAVATLALEKNLDADEIRDITKVVREFARLTVLPDGFTDHPGDAVAYQSWKLAQQKADLQERSRLIARGLKFAASSTARQKIEQLLTDFSVKPSQPAPRLPLYRLESDEELPRVLPVAGKLPLSRSDLQAVPMLEEIGPFQLVKFEGVGAWVPIPGWQVIRNAEDPVVLLCNREQLLNSGVDREQLDNSVSQTEELLVVVDRAQRQWLADKYFVVDQGDQLQLQWSEEAPQLPILGQVVLVMRPKRVLDEDYTKDPWQLDE